MKYFRIDNYTNKAGVTNIFCFKYLQPIVLKKKSFYLQS